MLPFLMFHAASTHAASTPTTPVKVFLLIGQSNMEGHGLVNVSAGAGVGNGTLQYAVEHHPSAGFPTCNITEAAARREGCNAAGADLDGLRAGGSRLTHPSIRFHRRLSRAPRSPRAPRAPRAPAPASGFARTRRNSPST